MQDSKKELEFWSEFISIVNDSKINLLFTIINKVNSQKMSWVTGTVLKKSYLKILELFALNKLKPEIKGKIIVESDPHQDIFLIKAHSSLQCQGAGRGTMSAYDYSQAITSLSLVNKGNLDVDVQIADTLALLAGLKYNLDRSQDRNKISQIESIKMRFIERKIANESDPSFFEVII